MNNNMLVEKIEEIVKPIVSELSYELYHIEYVKEDGNFYLRIYIDKKDDRISLNDCETVSRKVSEILDIDDPFDTPYYLEVSSPGIYRNLYKDEHYSQVVGKEILVKLTSSLNGTKSIKGILKNIDDNEIVILNDQNEISIPKEKIKSANLEGEI